MFPVLFVCLNKTELNLERRFKDGVGWLTKETSYYSLTPCASADDFNAFYFFLLLFLLQHFIL